MTKEIIYRCSLCGMASEEEQDIINCETRHLEPVEVIRDRDKYKHESWINGGPIYDTEGKPANIWTAPEVPRYVLAKMSNGSVARYMFDRMEISGVNTNESV
ncbi:MAG: hypothetical protein IJV64_09905 [Oscillospiraceae bacterium]|nr:hypothetical protein [Oscillospiraceae bacterium]